MANRGARELARRIRLEGRLRGRLGTAAVLAFGLSFQPALAGTMLVQPHRAVYSLKLEQSAVAADIGSLNGRMVMEWRGGPACDGYIVNQRIVTDVSDSDGNSMVRDLRLSSWEAADGDRFHFELDQFINGKRMDRLSGKATRDTKNAAALFDMPVGVTLELPEDVVFPSEFTVKLLETAAAGTRMLTVSVFEGAESDRRYDVTAIMGKKLPVEESNVSHALLEGVGAWPVHMSYFDPTVEEGVPDYEVSYWLFANGISSSLLMDYGDFSMRGDLLELDYLEPDDC